MKSTSICDRTSARRIYVLSILSALSLCGTVFAQDAPEVETAPIRARAVEVKGLVEFQPSPQAPYLPLKVGTVLAEGARVRSATASTALFRFESGDEARITENTQLTLTKLRRTVGTEKTETEVDLELGRLLNRVRARRIRGGSRYRVRTPTATSSVRGTRFAVSYMIDDASRGITTVQVWEGIVAVIDRLGREVELRRQALKIPEDIGLGEIESIDAEEARELDEVLEGPIDLDEFEETLDGIERDLPDEDGPIRDGRYTEPYIDDSSDDDIMRP